MEKGLLPPEPWGARIVYSWAERVLFFFLAMVEQRSATGGMMRLFLLLSLSALLWQPADAELLAVFSIQRHGARNVLPKTALLKESDARGGPALLPEGQRQAYNAGQ